jgi:uncharacterized protein HemX
MLSKILFGVVLAMGMGGYVYYNTTETKINTLEARAIQQANENNALRLAQDEQNRTIDALQSNLTRTTDALNTMASRNNEIQAEMTRYLDIFARHDLARLAAAKPGLIETRINRGTQDVFDTIESESAFIDQLDD